MDSENRVVIIFIWARCIASVAVCLLGGLCMYVSDGETGVGWAIFGLAILWCTGISTKDGKED